SRPCLSADISSKFLDVVCHNDVQVQFEQHPPRFRKIRCCPKTEFLSFFVRSVDKREQHHPIAIRQRLSSIPFHVLLKAGADHTDPLELIAGILLPRPAVERNKIRKLRPSVPSRNVPANHPSKCRTGSDRTVHVQLSHKFPKRRIPLRLQIDHQRQFLIRIREDPPPVFPDYLVKWNQVQVCERPSCPNLMVVMGHHQVSTRQKNIGFNVPNA